MPQFLGDSEVVRFLRRQRALLQAIAAVLAIFVALWNLGIKDLIVDALQRPLMLSAERMLVTHDGAALVSLINNNGGVASSAVPLHQLLSDKDWSAGDRGMLGIQFKRHHDRCPITTFSLQLIDNVGYEYSLISFNMSRMVVPIGTYTTSIPFVLPQDLEVGTYDLQAILRHRCEQNSISTPFVTRSINIK